MRGLPKKLLEESGSKVKQKAPIMKITNLVPSKFSISHWGKQGQKPYLLQNMTSVASALGIASFWIIRLHHDASLKIWRDLPLVYLDMDLYQRNYCQKMGHLASVSMIWVIKKRSLITFEQWDEVLIGATQLQFRPMIMWTTKRERGEWGTNQERDKHAYRMILEIKLSKDYVNELC